MIWSIAQPQSQIDDIAQVIVETVQNKFGPSVFKAFKFFDSNLGQGYFDFNDWVWALYQIGLEHLLQEDSLIYELFESICNSTTKRVSLIEFAKFMGTSESLQKETLSPSKGRNASPESTNPKMKLKLL